MVRILDLVGRRGAMTAKTLARELGVSPSTCYRLIGILLEEGFLRKEARGRYELGPAIALLRPESQGRDLDAVLEPVLEEMAGKTGRHAYLGVLSGGSVAVTQVKAPASSPPVGIVRGAHGASHALALGKVLIAGAGIEGASEYVSSNGLRAFTPMTIVRPDAFGSHLRLVQTQGYATDVEEFAEDLCCVAAPILDDAGKVEGAVGISTSARHFAGESRALISLVTRAAGEASNLLSKGHRSRGTCRRP